MAICQYAWQYVKVTSKMREVIKKYRVLNVLLFCALLIFTFVLYLATNAAVDRRTEREFTKETTRTTRSAATIIEKFSGSLYAGRSFLLSADNVDAQKWDKYFKTQESFSRQPGLSAFIYAEYFAQTVPAEEILRSVQQSNSNIQPEDLDIKNDNQPKLIVVWPSSMQGTTYNSVKGINVYREEKRRKAIDDSIAKRSIQITTPVVLATERPGIIMFLPVFNNNADSPSGFVLMSLASNEFFEHLFRDQDKNIAYKISDVTQDQEEQLYKSPGWKEDHSITRQDIINVADQRWRIDYGSEKSLYQDPLTQIVPYVVLFVGVLVCVVIALTNAYVDIGRIKKIEGS